MVKYMNLPILGLLIFGIFGILSITGSSLLMAGGSSLVVYSPFPGEHVTLINPECLVLNISVYDPAAPVNSTVGVTIVGPCNIKMTSAGVVVGSLNSSHELAKTNYGFPVTLFEKNGASLSQFIPGQYNVTISVAGASETISICVISPDQIEFLVYVYSNGVPLQGATVSVYNVTDNMLLLTNTTNSQGLATLIVPYVYTMTNEYNITAVKTGYQLVYQEVTVPADHITPVTVKLNTHPVVFVLTPIYFEDMGVVEPAAPAQLPSDPSAVYVGSAFMGTTFSIIINATMSGAPVSNAVIQGEYTINGKVSTSTAKYIGNGQYNLSIMLPNSTVPYYLQIEVTGTYESNTYTFTTLVSVEPNYVAIIENLQGEVQSLNKTVTALTNEVDNLETYLKGNVTYLNDTIHSLESEICNINKTLTSLSSEVTDINSTLTGEISTLHSEVNNLSTEVSNLQTKVSSLNSDVSSLCTKVTQLSSETTLIYGGLILGIIALIIAIVAIVLVFRKVA